MPFAKRVVKPVRLSRKHVDKENQFDLDVVSNNALVAAIQQLSDLSRHADSLFGELSQEFLEAVHRANKLKTRVDNLQGCVSKLNAKAVKVPEGDLDSYAKTKKHFCSSGNTAGSHTKGYPGSLFTPESRPDSVKGLYDAAEDNPVRIIRQCNANRTDGRTGSGLFTLTPFFQDDTYEVRDDDFEVKPRCYTKLIQCLSPQTLDTERQQTRQIPEAKKRPKSLSSFPEIETRPVSSDETKLPTPEDKVKGMSRSQPVILVPIDITGSGFDRMCEYRESVRSTSREYIDEGSQSLKKKRRRPTVSGAPGLVFNEVSSSLYNMNRLSVPPETMGSRSLSRERPKSAALEYYAPKHHGHKSEHKKSKDKKDKKDRSCDPEESNLARSCSLRRSLKSLFKDKRTKSTDLWVEGRPESPGPPMVTIQSSVKRSRSLPRSLKSVMRSSSSLSHFGNNRSASTEGRLDKAAEKSEKKEKHKLSSSSGRAGRTSQRNDNSNISKKIPRSVSHSSNVLSSYSTFVDNFERPKSMEIGPSTFLAGSSVRSAIPVASPISPTSSESVGSSVNAQDTHQRASTSSKHVHVHIPDKPWTKPFADVKLRGPSKVNGGIPRRDERQSSSSGHWSASSSSARHSASSPERLSQCDRDSAVSLNIHGGLADHDRLRSPTGEEPCVPVGDGDSSTLNGDSSETDSVIDVRKNLMKMSTKEWLKSVKNKKPKAIFSNGKTSKTSASASTSRISESKLTKHNLRVHDDNHHGASKSAGLLGDDESSIYSVDQDGFYTSMHKDCGLRRGHEQLLEEDEEDISSGRSTVSGEVDSASPDKGHSNISKKFSSFMSKRSTVKRKDRKSTPPPPPPRVTSALNKSNEPHTDDDSTPQTELQKLAALANKIAAAKAKQEQERGNVLERSTSFGSEAESLRTRVRLKSTIGPSAIPSLCMVTPIPTDDEDSDMLGYSSAWKPPSSEGKVSHNAHGGGLKSAKSAPGTLQDVLSGDEGAESSDWSTDLNDTLTEENKCSTWPRSPKPKAASSTKNNTQLTPPTSLTIQPPKCSLFYEDDNFAFVDSRHALPEVKTPDSVLDSNRGFESPTNNTFKVPQDTSTPVATGEKGEFSFGSPSINSILSQNVTNSDGTFANSSSAEKTPKKFDWTGTWPRSKGQSVLQSMSSHHTSKDDSLIESKPKVQVHRTGSLPRTSHSGSFLRKGDRAHFINATLPRRAKTPKTLPLVPENGSHEPQAAHAKLVISSPVANRASFVENPYKRSVCSPVSANDLLKFWNYSTADHWYNTLPRKGHPEVKHSLSFSSAQGLRDQVSEAPEPSINKVPKSATMFDFCTSEDDTNDGQSTLERPPSKPLYPSITSMKHSLNFSPPKESPGASYGRTWYDGVDASCAVVVMNPDNPGQPKGQLKSGFSAFLRDHSLGVPMPGNRRGSNASSISTNSTSSSGKKSVTFAPVHKTSNSSLSRTSIDASSISSSQVSELPQGSDTKSLLSDDGIQVTPMKREQTVAPSTQKEASRLISNLKRNSSGSADIPACTCHLETIEGSDSETTTKDDNNTPSQSPVKRTQTENEPTVKRLKVNVPHNVSKRPNSPNKHRLSPRGKIRQASSPPSSSAAPSIKIDVPLEKVVTDCGTEIKAMPLITTNFVTNTLKQDTPPTSAPQANPLNNTSVKHFNFPSLKRPDDGAKSSSLKREVSPPKSLMARPVGPPPPPPNSQTGKQEENGTTNKTENPSKLSTFFVAKSRPILSPVTSKAATEESSNQTGTDSATVRSKLDNDAVTNTALKVTSPVAPSTAPISKFPSSGYSSLKRSVPSSSASTTPSNFSSSSMKRGCSSANPSSSVSEKKEQSTLTSPSSSSAPTDSSTKPAPPRFVLPKLRSWNPSEISPTTSLLSRLNMDSKDKTSSKNSGSSVDATSSAATSRSDSAAPSNGASSGEVSVKSVKDSPSSASSGSSEEKSEKERTPEGAQPSRPSNVQEREHNSSVHKNLNKSFSSDERPGKPDRSNLRSSLNKSTSSLHRLTSSEHLTSSSLSLARSTSNIAGLSVSSSNLRGSAWSLAKSTDSLASNSSTAERSRAAKLAFMNSEPEKPQVKQDPVSDRFSKFSLGQKTLSLSRSNLDNIKESANNNNNNSTALKDRLNSSGSSTSSGSLSRQNSESDRESNNNNSRKSSCSSSSPVQGKFVTSVLSQLQKKGMNASTTKISQTASGDISPK